MEKLPFYIITSNATSQILPATVYLYNKYWQVAGGQNFKILGNQPPKEILPANFEFLKIKEDNDIHKWTKYLYNYILNFEQSKYFFLTLDDYLPNSKLNQDILSASLAFMQTNEKVGRLALGRLDVERWDRLKAYNNFSLVRLKQDAVYRLSCQTSVWNREYFLKYFNHEWTPWELELKGSSMAKNDGWEIIGLDGNWPFGWMEESALSGRWPGMVNILGMNLEDVKYLIEKKIFDPKKLQYGIWYECRIPFLSKFQSISKKLTKIPKFQEVGYDFKWKMIKPFVRSRTFNRLYSRYKHIYP